MLIDDENIRVQYDSTTESPIMAGDALPFPFRFIEKEQVKAILLDGTKLVFNEDYTVGLEEEEEEKPEGEDEASVSSDYTSVILNIDIPVGETITLYRETDLDQTSEFPQEARFSSRKIEDALDKLTMQNQEQREALGRAMKLPLTAAVDLKDLALPNPEPNKSVKWNSEGTALVNTSFDPDTALVTTENFKNQAQQAAKDSANSASASANSASVASQKVNEITALHSTYTENITNMSEDYKQQIDTKSTSYLNQISSRGNTIIKDADAIINRVGLDMFDTVMKDHLLTYEESQGLALQGTWVYHDAIAGERYGYQDFYNKCVEEKNEATPAQVTLGSETVTIYTHSNGHMFYDIGEKTKVDTFFATMGMAWYYGVDLDNKCIFLPRNLWFEQAANTNAGVYTDAGIPNHKHYEFVSTSRGTSKDSKTEQQLNNSTQVSSLWYSGYAAYNMARNSEAANVGLSSNPTSQAVYGKSSTVQPKSVKKLLYICVGNQVKNTSWVDVVTQVKNGVKDIETSKMEALATIQEKELSGIQALERKQTEGFNALSNVSDALRTTQITNCVTKIPKRVKLSCPEVGTLLLEKGSVITVPCGMLRDCKYFGDITMSTDGKVSGFSNTAYFKTPTNISLGSSFEINAAITTGDVLMQSGSTGALTFSGIGNPHIAAWGIETGTGNYFGYNIGDGTNWLCGTGKNFGRLEVQPNTTYYCRLTFDGTIYKGFVSTDNETWLEDWSFESTQIIPSVAMLWGNGRLITTPWAGTIHLNECSIKVNNEVVWSGAPKVNIQEAFPVGAKFLNNSDYEIVEAVESNDRIFVWVKCLNDRQGVGQMWGSADVGLGCIAWRPDANNPEIYNSFFMTGADDRFLASEQIESTEGTVGSWYDYTLNVIHRWDGTGMLWDSINSLPLGTFKYGSLHSDGKNYNINEILNIFDGEGYHGLFSWINKDVEGLLADGRFDDYTLRSIPFKTSKLHYSKNPASVVTGLQAVLHINDDGYLVISRIRSSHSFLDTKVNLIYDQESSSYLRGCIMHSYDRTAAIIHSFRPRFPFQAVDTNARATGATVVDTYVSGTSWYRVWSDGWIEQGGRLAYGSSSTATTVSLLKPMSDTNFHCQVTLFGATSGYNNTVHGVYTTVWNITQTSFTTQRYTANTIQHMWRVEGYMA